jgi:hypothetical protein
MELWTTIMTRIKPQLIKLIKCFLQCLIYYLIFFNFIILVKYIPLTAVHRTSSLISTFAPVNCWSATDFMSIFPFNYSLIKRYSSLIDIYRNGRLYVKALFMHLDKS